MPTQASRIYPCWWCKAIIGRWTFSHCRIPADYFGPLTIQSKLFRSTNGMSAGSVMSSQPWWCFQDFSFFILEAKSLKKNTFTCINYTLQMPIDVKLKLEYWFFFNAVCRLMDSAAEQDPLRDPWRASVFSISSLWEDITSTLLNCCHLAPGSVMAFRVRLLQLYYPHLCCLERALWDLRSLPGSRPLSRQRGRCKWKGSNRLPTGPEQSFEDDSVGTCNDGPLHHSQWRHVWSRNWFMEEWVCGWAC